METYGKIILNISTENSKRMLKMCSILVSVLAIISLKQPALAQIEENIDPRTYNTENNWTTCEQFVEGTQFDPKAVVNIDWKIFYFWNPELEESYITRFRWPAPMLIDRFKVELADDLKPPVNWDDAELFLETSIDFSALCMKTNTSGVYRLIPAKAFHYRTIPLLIFAFKLVKEGYLGIVNCKYQVAYALAPLDHMPFHYELEKAASSLNFYNHHNRSHLAVNWTLPLESPYVMDLPDDEMDEDLVEEDPGKVDFF